MSDGISDGAREMEERASNVAYRRALAKHLLGEMDRGDLDTIASESDDVRWRARMLKVSTNQAVDAELKGLTDEDRDRKRVAWAKLIAATLDVRTDDDKYSYGDLLSKKSPFRNCFFMLYSQGVGFSNAPPGFSTILAAITKSHGYEAARGRSTRLRVGDHLVVVPKSVLAALAKGAVVQISADRRTPAEVERDRIDFQKAKSARWSR